MIYLNNYYFQDNNIILFKGKILTKLKKEEFLRLSKKQWK
jgi:hypothetical protein